MFKNKFIAHFKGIRGSYPTPDKNFLNYGGNTACVYVAVNNHHIILDAGSGIANAAKQITENQIVAQNGSEIVINILLSHLHSDHIQGLPFLSFLHSPNATINIFGKAKSDEELKNNLSELLFEKSFPLSIGEIKANINIKALNGKNDDLVIILKDNQKEPILKKSSQIKKSEISNKDVLIKMLYSKTHPKDGVMLYRIEFKEKSLVYATDKESFIEGDKALSTFARETDLLIHDSQYTDLDYASIPNSKQGYGHSTFDMAIKEKQNSHAKNLAFFHYDPSYTDKKLDEIKKDIINKTEGLIMPCENQEFVLL